MVEPVRERSTDGYAGADENNSINEVRAVWISYLDFGPMMTGKTEKQFKASIEKAFANIRNFGLNTVFVQVRPFGDALYQSDYFPWSYLVTGTEGKDPGYDPLAVMVTAAREHGLKIEAWINPYRVRAVGNDKALAASNPAKKWLDAGNRSVVKYDNVISYNPASKEAQELIVNGAREIIRKYDVDGIHIDDYFYPHEASAFDQIEYSQYKKNGGTMTQGDWRRANVESLLKALYSGIKAEKSTALFGVSPQSSIYNNYYIQYLDVEKIVSEPGYCDYICPQVYFGFDNEIQPFGETVDAWDDMIKTNSVKLYVGMAAYKVGLIDNWAGTGSEEWLQNDDLMQRMVEHSRKLKHYGGFAVYRYDSLFNPVAGVKKAVQKEAANLKEIL
jgi:uncharacterized lipoprotein YddW (UPF0748 family)